MLFLRITHVIARGRSRIRMAHKPLCRGEIKVLSQQLGRKRPTLFVLSANYREWRIERSRFRRCISATSVRRNSQINKNPITAM